MKEYHKIQTVFKRDPQTKHKRILEGDYSLLEFAYLAQTEWVWTEKIDGTNIRVKLQSDGRIEFGGKTDHAQMPTNLLRSLEAIFYSDAGRGEAAATIERAGAEVCLYGEGYGATIQKVGGKYRQDQSFVLFDVRVGDVWLNRASVEEVGSLFGIEVTPVIGKGNLHEMVEFVRNGFNSQWGNFLAEGIVARPAVELRTRMGERIITKIKHRDFA